MGKGDEPHRPKTKNVPHGIDPKIGILARNKEIVAAIDEEREEHEAADLVVGGDSDSQTLRQLQMAPIRQNRAKQVPKTGDLRPRRKKRVRNCQLVLGEKGVPMEIQVLNKV
ncbi:uncharacterized protein LOC113343692 [Papaver somniferum]|uniref:uncharacterized protein LOC113343692 n=1 Tax=Papaver somniferum TaxID=3469 RepID=UPI000E6FDD78|nr:uncharacterized protein LOC113343692 [Papaver somniferum]